MGGARSEQLVALYHYANATCIACGQPELCEPAYEQIDSA